MDLYAFSANRPIVTIDVLGKNAADVALKRRGMQIPKAEGFSAGSLLAIALPHDAKRYVGNIVGSQKGIYFFPDNCELAAFNIRAGILREDNKKLQSDQYNSDRYITDDRINNFAMFENPSNPPEPQSPTDSIIIDDRLKKDTIEQLPEGVGEGGFYSGSGIGLEYAEFRGNTTPGSANAESFKGIFHTLMVGTPKGGGSAYVGAEKWKNGNWVGVTVGLYGPAIGVAVVDWDYTPIGRPYKLDTNPIGKYICEQLIKHVH